LCEDLNGLGVRDYNDFVPLMQEVAPASIPDPSAVFLLGSACIVGFARLRRKVSPTTILMAISSMF